MTCWTRVTRTSEVTSSVLSVTRRLTRTRSTAPAASLRRRRRLDPASPSPVLCPAAKFKQPSAKTVVQRPPAAGPRPSIGRRRPLPSTKVIPAGRRRTSSAPAAVPAHLLGGLTSRLDLQRQRQRRQDTLSTLYDVRRSAALATTPAATHSCVIIIITYISSRCRRSSTNWHLVAQTTTTTTGVDTVTPVNSTTRFVLLRVSRAPATTLRRLERRRTRQRRRRSTRSADRQTDNARSLATCTPRSVNQLE